MSVEVTYPHITKENGKPARLTRMPRIRISQIVGPHLFHGWSVDEICRQYPHLTLAEAHSAMTYYYDHQDEIDRELADEFAQIEEDRRKSMPSPLYLKLKAKGLL
ncbi:MAG: DUF433 domain-containing protein [Planctomycetes bacterium]|nr:DUF433 domain-containing protein [Planctomycetota bacterium]